jgi:hypothetical protein
VRVRRHAAAVVLLLCLAAAAHARPTIRGAKSYKLHEPIVLKAADVTSKAAQFLWDVSGDARFVEAPGEIHVWAPAGDYVVRLTAIDFDAKKVERATFSFTVEGAPAPQPPGPGPGPVPPGPEPKPPTPTKGLHVLILYESADATKLPAAQQGILYGKATRDWLNQNCSPWGGIKDWGIFDKDSDLGSYSPTLKALQLRPRASLPWVAIASDGPVVLYEGPLPADAASMLALLNKYRPASQRRKAG